MSFRMLIHGLLEVPSSDSSGPRGCLRNFTMNRGPCVGHRLRQSGHATSPEILPALALFGIHVGLAAVLFRPGRVCPFGADGSRTWTSAMRLVQVDSIFKRPREQPFQAAPASSNITNGVSTGVLAPGLVGGDVIGTEPPVKTKLCNNRQVPHRFLPYCLAHRSPRTEFDTSYCPAQYIIDGIYYIGNISSY